MKKAILPIVTVFSLISFSLLADSCPSGSEMKVMRNEEGKLFVTQIPEGYTLEWSHNLKEDGNINLDVVSMANYKGATYGYRHNRNYDIIASGEVKCSYTDKDWKHNIISISQKGSQGHAYLLGRYGWRQNYAKPDLRHVSCRVNNFPDIPADCSFYKVMRDEEEIQE